MIYEGAGKGSVSRERKIISQDSYIVIGICGHMNLSYASFYIFITLRLHFFVHWKGLSLIEMLGK